MHDVSLPVIPAKAGIQCLQARRHWIPACAGMTTIRIVDYLTACPLRIPAMTQHTPTLHDLEQHDAFIDRHIGPDDHEIAHMLKAVGYDSLDALVDAIVPATIRQKNPLALPPAMTETEALAKIRAIADKNEVFKSFIGQGYSGTHTPLVILRNILENPAWYTAYTPYQAEISQGRMEALINFQTMCADLTGMEIANASLLDEATAAAEAMTLVKRSSKSKSNVFFVSKNVHPQTIEVLKTRAEPLGIELHIDDEANATNVDCYGALLQYPDTFGSIRDYKSLCDAMHAKGALVAVATDLLALTLVTPPGEWGADIVVGNSQRFGVPFGFGGPHAAFMACRDAFKRSMPGTPDRRVEGRAGQQRLPFDAADARTAHPPREGHVQHLHRAGAAGRDGRDVRGVPRPGRTGAHRTPHAPAGRDPRRRVAQGRHRGRRRFLRHPARHRHRRAHHPCDGQCGARQPAPHRRPVTGDRTGRNHHARRRPPARRAVRRAHRRHRRAGSRHA
jgi:hypothetical protein